MKMEKLRTVTFLDREQIDFLDNLDKDALFYQGTKLSRVHILSELVDLLMALRINIKDINLKQETLAQGILKIITNHKDKENV